MLKEKMRIEATHVKKKQLHQYLPAEILQKKKKQSIPDINRNSSGNVGNLNRTFLEGSPLDSSRDTDVGTPFGSPALLQKSSKPNTQGTEDLQNQPLPNGTKLSPSPNSSSSKRPHSPTLEESPKRLKDLPLMCTIEPDDCAFKQPYSSNEEDILKSRKDGQVV
eukprot:g38520.t1